MSDFKQLADRAFDHAGKSRADRRSWLCAAVLLSVTATPRAARRGLADIRDPGIRARTAELLDELLASDVPATGGAEQEGTT